MNTTKSNAKENRVMWIKNYLPVLLFAWFWIGMIVCGLLAPHERVQDLESSIITEGWHLSVMAAIFGCLTVLPYWFRVVKDTSAQADT